MSTYYIPDTGGTRAREPGKAPQRSRPVCVPSPTLRAKGSRTRRGWDGNPSLARHPGCCHDHCPRGPRHCPRRTLQLSRRLREPQLPSSANRWGYCSPPAPVNGASMRWKDSLGPNLTEARVSNSFQRVLDSAPVYNDTRACHSKGTHLSLTETRGWIERGGAGDGKGKRGNCWKWGPPEGS